MNEKILNFSEKPLVHLESEVEWRIEDNPVPYEDSIHFMETCVDEIRNKNRPETVWLLEHPALYTAGTSADPAELLDKKNFPVIRTGRGGRFTYHGPGQRIAYVMIDLKLFQKFSKFFTCAHIYAHSNQWNFLVQNMCRNKKSAGCSDF